MATKVTTIDIGVNYGSSKYTFEEVKKIVEESTTGYTEEGVHYSVEKFISISNSLKRNTNQSKIS
jgi:hypothetical protein